MWRGRRWTAAPSRRTSGSSPRIRSSRQRLRRLARRAVAAHDVDVVVGDRLGERLDAGREREHAAAGGDRLQRDLGPAMPGVEQDAAGAGHERGAGGGRSQELRVARAQAVVALVQLAAQDLLDRARGGDDDGEAERVDDADVAGQVDDPEHPAAVGIHDRRGRARPALDGLGEVLGGEDLHRVAGGDRRADGVRARRRLAPQRALDEVHLVGGAVSQAACRRGCSSSMPSASRDRR